MYDALDETQRARLRSLLLRLVMPTDGEPVRVPGMLKHVKAIGWYVEEYGIAQVSMNLTNLEETPLHAGVVGQLLFDRLYARA